MSKFPRPGVPKSRFPGTTDLDSRRKHVILSEAKDPRVGLCRRLFYAAARCSPRKLFQVASICLLAVTMLGASPAPDASARFDRVGHKMMCVCGCGQVLLDCNHVGCPDSSRMIGELRDQMAGPNGTGADSLLFNWFIAKYGATVLAAPIRGGFDNVAWGIPVALFLLATVGTGLLVRVWARRTTGQALAGGPASLSLSPSSDALRERIRRETEY